MFAYVFPKILLIYKVVDFEILTHNPAKTGKNQNTITERMKQISNHQFFECNQRNVFVKKVHFL